jgi:hypothetical protein
MKVLKIPPQLMAWVSTVPLQEGGRREGQSHQCTKIRTQVDIMNVS